MNEGHNCNFQYNIFLPLKFLIIVSYKYAESQLYGVGGEKEGVGGGRDRTCILHVYS